MAASRSAPRVAIVTALAASLGAACSPDARLGVAAPEPGAGGGWPSCVEPPPSHDGDGDGLPDAIDVCPDARDAAQLDSDGDGVGDACDPCPLDDTDGCVDVLLALYRLDESAGATAVADAGPAGAPGGAVVGSVTFGAPGRVGTAARFDGAGRVELTSVGTASELSLSARVRLAAAGSGTRTLVASAAYAMSVDASGRLRCAFFANGLTAEVTATAPLVAESWHHVACVRPVDPTSPTPRIGAFVDGVFVAAAVAPPGFEGPGAPGTVVLGAAPDGTAGLVGELDDVRFVAFGVAVDADRDRDGVADVVDVCPGVPNFGQLDANADFAGEACARRSGSLCQADADCDDANPCTSDACTPCGCVYRAAAGACDDGDAFTAGDACQDGRCSGSHRDYAPASDETLPAGDHFFARVSIPVGVTVTCAGATEGAFYGRGCVLHAAEIDIAGTLTADGMGYGPSQGPGAGSDGGSHGGAGYGAVWDATYGDLGAPSALGSGGLGSAGGGSIRIVATGAVRIDGALTARGAPHAGFHTGAGGSLWIRAAALTGTGLVSAAGGPANADGEHGGGGGRIKLEVLGLAFAGERSVAGGGSAGVGTLVE
ncbi:MAG: LamG domain-containing protein [Myxococcales bacterium]|nr:LamG domain-containing protein [Myxococcales bacterium]